MNAIEMERGVSEDLASALTEANLAEFHWRVGQALMNYIRGCVEAADAVDDIAALYVQSAVANQRVWESVGEA